MQALAIRQYINVFLGMHLYINLQPRKHIPQFFSTSFNLHLSQFQTVSTLHSLPHVSYFLYFAELNSALSDPICIPMAQQVHSFCKNLNFVFHLHFWYTEMLTSSNFSILAIGLEPRDEGTNPA